jgi:hypothetical protein
VLCSGRGGFPFQCCLTAAERASHRVICCANRRAAAGAGAPSSGPRPIPGRSSAIEMPTSPVDTRREYNKVQPAVNVQGCVASDLTTQNMTPNAKWQPHTWDWCCTCLESLYWPKAHGMRAGGNADGGTCAEEGPGGDQPLRHAEGRPQPAVQVPNGSPCCALHTIHPGVHCMHAKAHMPCMSWHATQ